MKRLATVLLLVPITVSLLNGCTESPSDGLPGSDSDSNTYHSTGWKDNPQHGNDYSSDPQNCKACHGSDLGGGSSGVSCEGCHHGWSGDHWDASPLNPDNCKACHGTDFKGGLTAPSCLYCHHYNDWDDTHHGVKYAATSDTCKGCHGADLTGGFSGLSCVGCHDDNLHHTGGEDLCCNIPACHAGGGGGEGCDECHGHDAGFGGATGGKGTFKSHSTHTENDDSDELKGPSVALDCGDCHDTNNYPYFNSGTGTVPYDLSETDVCNNCHSPDGDYNGVDSQDSVGAKDNWAEGVYDGAALKANKEKWCVGCHDDEPAVIDGVSAPKVGGDGATYGYFANGHGNAPNNTELACTDCHDLSFTHIDGDDRTYTFTGYDGGSSYQAGYRLKSIEGQPPMKIPSNAPGGNSDFRLCFSCHDSSKILDVVVEPFDTNFNSSGASAGYSYVDFVSNEHNLHVVTFAGVQCWDSDWDLSTNGGRDSLVSCVICHNVHGSEGYAGSTNEAMIRDGKLVNGRPDVREGFKFSYVIEDPVLGLPNVTSAGATRANSIGAVFRSDKVKFVVGGLCAGCHGHSANENTSYDATGDYLEYYRTPIAE